jgi:CBS domain-containing protein
MGAVVVPTARDLMARNLVTLVPETLLFDAIAILLGNDISGAPVVDRDGRLVGLLSEFDCLRVIAAGEFHDYGYYAETTVADVMTHASHTIDPSLDLWAIAAEFVRHRVRRLPVLENGKLIGQVSRRDLLAALDRDRQARRPGKRYPDYPEGREPRDR